MKLKRVITSDYVIKITVTLMILFSSALVFEFKKLSFFILLQCLFCFACFLKYRDVYFYEDGLFWILVSIVISGILPWFSDNPTSYKLCTRNYMIMWLVLYFSITYLRKWINGSPQKLYYIIRVIKIAFLIQFLWFPLQYFSFHFLRVDINDLIFNSFLGLRERVSFIRDGIYYPSGLTWHSALIAPMFVLSLALFDELWIKCLILLDVAICGNTTSLIGVSVYLVLYFLCFFSQGIKKNNIKKITFLFVALLPLLVFSGLAQKVVYVFANLIKRIIYLGDESTLAHLRYFSSIPEVYGISSLSEILWGYGNACSGLPHSILYSQYANLKSWVVECDVVNILLSNGIFGFIVFYAFYIGILFRGWHINKKYSIVMLAIIVEGFFYNVQFDYVLMIECIMFFSINWKIDFFKSVPLFKRVFKKRKLVY